MLVELNELATFGVAGNFTGHLEQAGEAADFTAVKTADATAPKAIFPTYIPARTPAVPDYLSIFPFDEYRIIFPAGEEKLQIEPECAIICDVNWGENGKVTGLKPFLFGASNDCSIRRPGAPKISMKKNWGRSSKGFASHQIRIDSFTAGGILSRYRIASFLVRDGVVHDYGEDSAVRDYSYFYDKLLAWCVDRFNNQPNEGPAEAIGQYLIASGCPKRIMISVGATRYTAWGQSNFLKEGDQAAVILYPEDQYDHDDISTRLRKDNLEEDDLSVLVQEVVLGNGQ